MPILMHRKNDTVHLWRDLLDILGQCTAWVSATITSICSHALKIRLVSACPLYQPKFVTEPNAISKLVYGTRRHLAILLFTRGTIIQYGMLNLDRMDSISRRLHMIERLDSGVVIIFTHYGYLLDIYPTLIQSDSIQIQSTWWQAQAIVHPAYGMFNVEHLYVCLLVIKDPLKP